MKLLDNLIRYSFYLLFFLVPLIFTSVNYELFEYNKMMLTYSLTVVIASLWLVKMITSKEFRIQRTPFDWPILIYLLSSFFSTITSINVHTSLWGYYSRSHGGLLSTLSYIILYYAFVSNIAQKFPISNSQFSIKNTKKFNNQQPTINNSLYVLLLSAFLVTLYGILEHFGIDSNYWVQDVKNRVFSTLGQPNWLAAFIDALIFIPLALALASKSKIKKSFFSFLFSVFFLCLVFTNSKSGLLAFFAGLLIFTLFTFKAVKPLLAVWLFSLLAFFIFGQNVYKPLLKITQSSKIQTQSSKLPYSDMVISSSSEIRKVVWSGAIKVWQHYPVFGSGLETFAYSYYNFRPKEHNLLSEWDFLYNKAHNEFINILACQGTFGILSYLFLIGSFIYWSGKKILSPNTYYLTPALLAGYVTILITNFFGFSVVIIGILFYIIPALSLNELDSRKSFILKLPIFKPLSFLFLGTGIYLVFSLVKMWQADFYFSRAEKEYSGGYLINSFLDFEKASRLNFSEPLYHSYLSQASARLTLAYYQTDATGSAELIRDLKNLTEAEANITVSQNPVHTSYWRSAANAYNFLAKVEPEYQNKAIQSITKAAELAPTDPRNYFTLAELYLEQKDYPNTEINLKKTIDLKPNYRKARINLIMLYDQLDQKDKAREQAIFILTQIDNKDEFSLNWMKNFETRSTKSETNSNY